MRVRGDSLIDEDAAIFNDFIYGKVEIYFYTFFSISYIHGVLCMK